MQIDATVSSTDWKLQRRQLALALAVRRCGDLCLLGGSNDYRSQWNLSGSHAPRGEHSARGHSRSRWSSDRHDGDRSVVVVGVSAKPSCLHQQVRIHSRHIAARGVVLRERIATEPGRNSTPVFKSRTPPVKIRSWRMAPQRRLSAIPA